MNQENNYFEVVGAYLDNELEGKQLEQFEKELEQNPALKQEVTFQKDIIQGIKQNRHNQLKSRLDNLDVSGASGGSSTSTLLKTAGAVIVAGLIGYGIYYFTLDSEPTVTEDYTEIQAQNQEPVEVIADEGIEEADQSKETGIQQTVDESTPEEKSEDQVSEPVVEDENNDSQLPVADIPEVSDDFADEATEMEDIELDAPDVNMDKSITSGQSNISIEVTKKRKYNFHYQLTEDRLLLYGDFDDEPYELIEINLADGKALFLNYQDKYYQIDKNEEITPLESVTDLSIIEKIKGLEN